MISNLGIDMSIYACMNIWILFYCWFMPMNVSFCEYNLFFIIWEGYNIKTWGRIHGHFSASPLTCQGCCSDSGLTVRFSVVVWDWLASLHGLGWRMSIVRMVWVHMWLLFFVSFYWRSRCKLGRRCLCKLPLHVCYVALDRWHRSKLWHWHHSVVKNV